MCGLSAVILKLLKILIYWIDQTETSLQCYTIKTDFNALNACRFGVAASAWLQRKHFLRHQNKSNKSSSESGQTQRFWSAASVCGLFVSLKLLQQQAATGKELTPTRRPNYKEKSPQRRKKDVRKQLNIWFRLFLRPGRENVIYRRLKICTK